VLPPARVAPPTSVIPPPAPPLPGAAPSASDSCPAELRTRTFRPHLCHLLRHTRIVCAGTPALRRWNLRSFPARASTSAGSGLSSSAAGPARTHRSTLPLGIVNGIVAYTTSPRDGLPLTQCWCNFRSAEFHGGCLHLQSVAINVRYGSSCYWLLMHAGVTRSVSLRGGTDRWIAAATPCLLHRPHL